MEILNFSLEKRLTSFAKDVDLFCRKCDGPNLLQEVDIKVDIKSLLKGGRLFDERG